MSLMLDALKRIEARQASARATAPTAVQTCTQSPVAVVEAIELPPELTADDLPELAAEQFALPGAVSLETAMSELTDLLAEVRLLDQPPAAQEVTEDEPVFAPVDSPLVQPPEVTEDEPVFAPVDSPVVQPPVVQPPVVQPTGSDPYAAMAWQIVRQLSGDCPDSCVSKNGNVPFAAALALRVGIDPSVMNTAAAVRSQVLLFTSPSDGQGKTMTLAQLLPHVSRVFTGDILVVDANSRNPDMARWLEAAVTWRLTDVLAGATHWANAVRPTGLPRVSLLPGGTEAPRRSHAPAASRLFRELAGHYELVLVDASSLAHEGTAQLAAACDGTYLVVRVGETSPRMVRESVRVIADAGSPLLGCIAIDGAA